MAEFTTKGEEMIEKEATATGNSAHVYVPKEWAGCTLKIIRVDDVQTES
jgi:putative transposon-encoded protein